MVAGHLGLRPIEGVNSPEDRGKKKNKKEGLPRMQGTVQVGWSCGVFVCFILVHLLKLGAVFAEAENIGTALPHNAHGFRRCWFTFEVSDRPRCEQACSDLTNASCVGYTFGPQKTFGHGGYLYATVCHTSLVGCRSAMAAGA